MAKLYVIPGSHPCECAEAALQLKGIAYRRVDGGWGTATSAPFRVH